ncbi:MAG: hypothetical protein ACOC6D_03685, partial [Atribacterota bacterium]
GDKRGYYTHYYVDRNILRKAADKLVELSRIVPFNNECHQDKDCLSANNHHSQKEVNQNEL